MYFYPHFTDEKIEGGLNEGKQLKSGTRENLTQGEGLICKNRMTGKHLVQRDSEIRADILWKALPHS